MRAGTKGFCKMARYDYRCTSCGNVFEVEHPMSERPEINCPTCGQPAERVFNASGISFKGSGFYNTDQRGGSSSTEGTSGSSCSTCGGGNCSCCG